MIVQPIFHGFDHSYVTSALQKYPDRFKGMLLVDPTLPPVCDRHAVANAVRQCCMPAVQHLPSTAQTARVDANQAWRQRRWQEREEGQRGAARDNDGRQRKQRVEEPGGRAPGRQPPRWWPFDTSCCGWLHRQQEEAAAFVKGLHESAGYIGVRINCGLWAKKGTDLDDPTGRAVRQA